jgi:hypothetical protein
MLNRNYVVGVSVLTFIFPLAATSYEHFRASPSETSAGFKFDLFSKWFIFSGVGLRLFFAGIKQSTDPSFTAKQIFHIEDEKSFPVVRELGFANLCFGLVGIISLFRPEWREVSAFASGIYYGLAGCLHLIKGPATENESFALWTDFVISGLLAAFATKSFSK